MLAYYRCTTRCTHLIVESSITQHAKDVLKVSSKDLKIQTWNSSFLSDSFIKHDETEILPHFEGDYNWMFEVHLCYRHCQCLFFSD